MDEEATRQYAGMTVNERLCVAGLIAAWDAAVRRRDAAAMRDILLRVGVNDPDHTVTTVLADPARYGF